MPDYVFIACLVALYFGSLIWNNVIKPKLFASKYRPPFRKLANGQRFSKAYLHEGEFTSTGFEATFIMVFSTEQISVDFRGFAIVSSNGTLTPNITDSWCETYQRPLTIDETDMVFSYVTVHDKDFLDQLKACNPRDTFA